MLLKGICAEYSTPMKSILQFNRFGSGKKLRKMIGDMEEGQGADFAHKKHKPQRTLKIRNRLRSLSVSAGMAACARKMRCSSLWEFGDDYRILFELGKDASSSSR